MPVEPTLGHRAPLLWIVLPFAAGIACAHAWPSSAPAGLLPVAAAVVGLGVIVALCCRRHDSALVLMLLGVALAGMLRHEIQRNRLPDWNSLPAREAEITVEAVRVFRQGGGEEPCSLVARIVTAAPHLADLQGQRFYIRAWRNEISTTIERGSILRLRGLLEPLPRRPEGDAFLAWLADSGLNFSLPRARLLEVSPPESAYARGRAVLKSHFGRILTTGLEHRPALAGALRAMLLGERDAIPEEAEAVFLRSGTMHLFAISGLHIGVIAGAMYGGLRALRLGPVAAFVIGAVLLAGYVDLVGAPPSAVRAWLMVTCVQAAFVCRAPGNSLAAIAGSALLVLLLDPHQLFSVGFQLSYGIVFALLLHGLPLGQRLQTPLTPWRSLPVASLASWQRTARGWWSKCVTVAAMGWSASLVGLIGGVLFFGWFTPMGFFANLVLIPAASLVIVGGFVAMTLGALGLGPMALVFNHGAALLLWLMQHGLDSALRVPATSYPAAFVHPWWGGGGLVLLLGAMVWGYARGWPDTKLLCGLPVGIVVVVLVTGLRFV